MLFRSTIRFGGVARDAVSKRFKHILPDLPYDYDALEPVISAEIMKLHHQRHHASYITALNIVEEKMQEALSRGAFLEHSLLIYWES